MMFHHLAASSPSVEELEWYIDQVPELDWDNLDGFGRTPLIHAALADDIHNPSILPLLLQLGVSLTVSSHEDADSIICGEGPPLAYDSWKRRGGDETMLEMLNPDGYRPKKRSRPAEKDEEGLKVGWNREITWSHGV